MWLRFLAFPLAVLAGLLAAGLLVMGLVIALAFRNLPSLQALTEYQPKVPLRVYSAEGVLIGEFGEERRAVVSIAEVPPQLKAAILAAEDERFYQHAGIDYVGVLRAAYTNLVAGGRRQGASTITMQVARNFFLSSEKTLTRTRYEALLGIKIEANLSKDQILELCVIQSYLGQRAYGFGAASQIYFGKALGELNLAEMAMLAGLPKAPSLYNPVANPQRAKQRQQYVLRRMKEVGHISAAQHDDAVKLPLRAKRLITRFTRNRRRGWFARPWPRFTRTMSIRGAFAFTPRFVKWIRKWPTWPCGKPCSNTTANRAIAGRKVTRSCRRRPTMTISTRRSPSPRTTPMDLPRWCSASTRSRCRRPCAPARRSTSRARACASRRALSTPKPLRRSAGSGAARLFACSVKASPGRSSN